MGRHSRSRRTLTNASLSSYLHTCHADSANSPPRPVNSAAIEVLPVSNATAPPTPLLSMALYTVHQTTPVHRRSPVLWLSLVPGEYLKEVPAADSNAPVPLLTMSDGAALYNYSY